MQQVQLSWPRQHAPAGILARPLKLIQGCTASAPSEAPNMLPALRPGKGRRHGCWGISIPSCTEHATMASSDMHALPGAEGVRWVEMLSPSASSSTLTALLTFVRP